MAWTIDGVAGRALGVTGGLAMIVPAVLFWGLLGSVTTNIPFPAEGFIESMIPFVATVPDRTLPLIMAAPVLLFCGLFILVGTLVGLGALLKPDYAVNLRIGGTGREPGN